MTTEQFSGAIGLLVVLALFAYVVSIYNSVQRLIQIIPESESNIAVLRKKRTGLDCQTDFHRRLLRLARERDRREGFNDFVLVTANWAVTRPD